MIKLTRLNHSSVIVNSDLIEHIEVTPDTVVTLTSGQKLIVLESAEEIVERVITFRRSIFPNGVLVPAASDSDSGHMVEEPLSHGR